jgi:subtilase family serine protease
LPPSARVGDSISVSWMVHNQGGSEAAQFWRDAIYVSSDTVLDATDTLVQAFSEESHSPLAPGATYSEMRDVIIPETAGGDRFLLFVTDRFSEQAETDESNNVLARPITIFLPPDVSIDLEASSDTGASAFDNVTNDAEPTFAVTVNQAGLVEIDFGDDGSVDETQSLPAAGTLRFTSPTLSDGERVVRATFTADAGGTDSKTITITIDTTGPHAVGFTPGVPFNQLHVDFNERMTPLTRSAVTSFADPDGADRTADLRFVTGTSGELAGRQFTMHFADQVRLGTYMKSLGPAAIFDLAGNPLDQNQNGTPGEPADGFTAVVPVQTMDLVVSEVAPATPAALFGRPIDVTWTVTNRGGEPAEGTWIDRIWFSADDSLDPFSDQLLSSRSINDVAPLQPGDSYTRSASVTLPLSNDLPPGTYRLLVQTDASGERPELNEFNNVTAAVLDVSLPPLPDLVVSNVSAPVQSFSNQRIEVSWTLTNQGTDPASGTWTDRVSLSSDAAIGGDQQIGEFSFTVTIPSGASITRTQAVEIPFASTGDQYVVVETDAGNAIFEHSLDANNTAIDDTPVRVTLSQFPNLTVDSITSSATEATIGQRFTVDFTVHNDGTGATNASFWRESVYLSVDDELDGTDILIGNATNGSFLNAGEAYASSIVATAPFTSEGDYFLIVKTDNLNHVQEFIAEGDNMSLGPRIHINFPPPPDLVVASVAAPEFAFSGQPMSITWTVRNQGTGVAVTSWDDAVYMSADDVFDASDRLLGTFRRQPEYQVIRMVSYFDPFGIYESCFGEPSPDPQSEVVFSSTHFEVTANAFESFLRSDRSQVICDRMGQQVQQRIDYDFHTESHSLNPGEAYTVTRSVTLPVGVSGPFHFFVQSDARNTVNEFAFDLNNANYDATATSVNLTPPPDLEVDSVTAPAAAQAGHAVTFQYAAANRGATRTPNSSWIDSFYLSADDVLDPAADIFLGDRTIALPAARFATPTYCQTSMWT